MEYLDDLTFNTMYRVLQSGMWLLNDIESFLRPFDMSQARLSILLAVIESPDGFVSPKDIALITGKSRPGITRMIEKLSETGILTISPDSTDGRRKLLSLTAKGKDLLNEIIPGYNQRVISMSANFSNEEKHLLNSLLGRINFLDKDKSLRELL